MTEDDLADGFMMKVSLANSQRRKSILIWWENSLTSPVSPSA
jgi:hypothetical protein